MLSRLKTAALATLVAVAALMPLFGDPRVTPVTHPIWARMLLRALEMNETVRASTQASEVFSALSWRDSLTFAAERFLSADGVTVREQAGVRCVAAAEGTGQVVYPLSVIRGGDYRMRVRLAGATGPPATAEIAAVGQNAAGPTFTFALPATAEWVRGAPTHLDPGAYTATVLLPRGSALEYVEVAPPCLDPIEPVGGWQPAAVATVDDVAVTMLKAIDVEDELPPADVPLRHAAADFQVEAPSDRPASGFDGARLKAERDGLQASLTLDLPEAGLYTISASVVTGAGQRWLADGCRKAVLCPSANTGWRVIMTQAFAAGRHTLTVVLADGAVVEGVRAERKKQRPGDYLATLRRLGFDPGPEGPVTRAKAADAMKFVQEQRRRLLRGLCGDVVLPEPVEPNVTVAAATPTAPSTPPGAASQPGPGSAPPPSPIGGVVLPPQLTASPVTPLLAEAVRPNS